MTALPYPPAERPVADPAAVRGSNQSDMRAHNERLFLTLIRQNGALAKSDLARMTGLSAQTVSVIMRELEGDGLLLRGEPLRGRIGQPSVPISLNPEGAFFLGLKIGRRSAELTLIDFLGHVRASEREIYSYPTPEQVWTFVAHASDRLLESLGPAIRYRVRGLGVAMPFKMWDWGQRVGAPLGAMEQWRDCDIQGKLEELTGLQVFVQNDASAACGAELLFGRGERPRNFLYFYFGTFIGGGLVMGGQLYLGPTGNAAGVGSMPTPGAGGAVQNLIEAASIQQLADEMEKTGESAEHLWEQADQWRVNQRILTAWIDRAAAALAWGSASAAALLELDAVLIDGWMPPHVRSQITDSTRQALGRLDLAGIEAPVIREGSIGADARTLGAAAIPLSQRYMIDQNAIYRT